MTASKPHAHVIGAGPIGLICAWKLLENGYDVDIYEQKDRVGGMCRSFPWREFVVDVGPHIYHTPDPKLEAFWKKEFGQFLVEGKFYCKNVKGEDFQDLYDYPLSWEAVSKFPESLRKKIIEEMRSVSAAKRSQARSYREYMDAQVGPTLREMFYEKYPEKLWGIKIAELTADWAPKRIKFRQKISPFYENEFAAVGRGGTGALYEEIAERIRRLGGRIHFDRPVVSFETRGDSIKSIGFTLGEKVAIDPKDVVISSIPLTLTARLLGHESKLKFRGVRLGYFAVDRSRVMPDGVNWLYYDSERVLFNRVTESKTMSPDVAPAGKTFLTVEVAYGHGDAVDRMDDERFLARIRSDLELVGLVHPGEVRASLSLKEPYVYPIQHKGYQEELVRTRAVLNSYPQLYSLGTGGDFNYADSQILFHMAFDTVSNICGKESSLAQTIREVVPVRRNRSVRIADREIGPGNPAFIIAEAGMNHNGSVELACELVDAAIRAGCDAVKFQTFGKGSRVSSKMKGVNYAEKADGLQENIYEMFDRLAMPFSEQKKVFEYGRSKGIEIFSTPFDFESVDFLEEMKVNLYKIASMDLVNLPLIRYVAQKGKPMILSTGMSTLAQVEEAIDAVLKEGNPDVILLHCNSSYPAAEHEMNLEVIRTLKTAFQVPVGFSDHTFGLFVSQTALSIGAEVIERHFTLSRSMEGPDHILSSEPEEMAELVDWSNRIPRILGDGIKRIQPNEYITLNAQRRCLYAAVDIGEGEKVTSEKIRIKGPGGGILPKYYDIVLNRTARRPIERDTPITWDSV